MSKGKTPAPAAAVKKNGRVRRLALMESIRKERGNPVICYVTGDRQNLETRIGGDAVPVIAEHLRALSADTIDLVLYSPGGDVMAALSIMRCIRGFATKYHVLVPFRAFSAATLIAAGANSIVMGRLGQLGPVDPKITTPFCPPAPGGPPPYLGVSVEEVNSYFDLAKRTMGAEDNRKEGAQLAFRELAGQLHPLALGAVERARTQNTQILTDALSSHMTPEQVKHPRVQACINKLTQGLPSHGYPISYAEAHEMGLPVERASPAIDGALWSLYREHADLAKMNVPFNPRSYAPDPSKSTSKELIFTPALVESSARLDVYTLKYDLTWMKEEVIVPGGGKVKRRALQCQQKGASWEKRA